MIVRDTSSITLLLLSTSYLLCLGCSSVAVLVFPLRSLLRPRPFFFSFSMVPSDLTLYSMPRICKLHAALCDKFQTWLCSIPAGAICRDCPVVQDLYSHVRRRAPQCGDTFLAWFAADSDQGPLDFADQQLIDFTRASCLSYTWPILELGGCHY